MANYGVKLRRYEIAQANHKHLRGFRIRIEVVDTCGGVDSNIFLYRRAPANAFDGSIADEFQTVCSFPDMSEYPAGTPSPETYFREDYIELDVRSMRDYDYIWERIMLESSALMNALTLADTLVAAEDAWIGCEPEETVSESLSESTSA